MPGGMRRRWMWGTVLVVLAGCVTGGGELALERAPDAPVERVAAELAPPSSTTTTTVPSTTTSVPASTTAPSTTAAPTTTSTPPSEAWTVGPYHGFGAWLDTYDWATTFAKGGGAPVGPEVLDHMAAEGVETLYIQASRWNSPTDVLEPERLQAFIDRAHAHGIDVVAWYLPTLVDPMADLRRMLAIAALDVDGLAVDIEARNLPDVAERNRVLLSLSRSLREQLPGRALGAIVMEPVLMEDVNPNFWPGFPWAELAPSYDVWLPMSYWTNRVGAWRSAHAYTGTNIARVRERIGDPGALVHTIGGVGDQTTTSDLVEMVTAAVEHRAIGGSLYDYRTSRPEFWSVLRAFRSG